MGDQEKDVSKAKGGFARAVLLSPEARSEIAKKAADARWGTAIPKATHVGELQIAGQVMSCAVLEDGRRLLTQETFLQAVGRSKKGKGGQTVSSPDGLPPFLSADSIKTFVSNDLRAATVAVRYRTPKGGVGIGYEADLLPKVCAVYLQARDAGKTTKQQAHIVKACDLLIRGLAHVGIIALVDEATGFQEIRDRQALQEILDRFLRKEFAAWAKVFPDEFYREIFRLRKWAWKGMKVNRPQCVANYTKDVVYERLAPGILEELNQRNPLVKGRRKSKHFQWLTDDIGHPALAQHLHAVIGLMRASEDWVHFMKMMNRAFPKRSDSLQMTLFTEDELAST